MRGSLFPEDAAYRRSLAISTFRLDKTQRTTRPSSAKDSKSISIGATKAGLGELEVSPDVVNSETLPLGDVR